jgi:hypothetical protein
VRRQLREPGRRPRSEPASGVIFETTPIVPAEMSEDGKPMCKKNLFMTALECNEKEKGSVGAG